MNEVVIVGAARTPFGRLAGQLSGLSAVELGAAAVKGALNRAGLSPNDVDAVIFGQVLQAGAGQNPARQTAVAAGIPLTTPASTVNRVCLSGLSAIIDAARLIRLGERSVVVAGGQESMSQSPHLLATGRTGVLYGAGTLIDSAEADGLTDAFVRESMGLLTDRVAGAEGINRAEQDALAASSHRRAHAAQSEGRFAAEITSVAVPQRRGEACLVKEDEGIRPDTTPSILGRLRPAFRPDGTITAGNASGLNDGAAAVVLTSRAYAEANGLAILAVVGAAAQIAGPDTSLLDKPSQAIRAALSTEGWQVADLDLIEINEAFAAVGVFAANDLGVDPKIVNVNGGAIALGHPIGASGARIVVTAVLELQRRGAGKAAVGICGGGGQGDALLLSR